MKKAIWSLLAVFVLSFGCANTGTSQETVKDLDYQLWADVLQEYVNEEGLVDYKALKKNSAKFDQFMTQVENIDISSFSDVEKKTFWINAYNAITMNVIVDKYPVKGIRTINFGLVWKIGRPVAGQKLGLEHIEHKIIRPLGDPRIHFAINCASIGCPVLPNIPFYAETLDAQLEKAAVAFINNPAKVRLDRGKNTLYYSAIFDWFEEDFLVVEDSLLSYIKKYINPEDRAYLDSHEVKMEVLDYDWKLNEQK